MYQLHLLGTRWLLLCKDHSDLYFLYIYTPAKKVNDLANYLAIFYDDLLKTNNKMRLQIYLSSQ